MYINPYAKSQMINSFLTSNKIDSSFGGMDIASKNMQKLNSMLESRSKRENAFSAQLSEYRTTSKAFYGDFYSNMSDVKSAASKLKTFSSDSVLKPTGYSSDNASVITGVSGNLDSRKDVAVEVSQIATGQKTSFEGLSTTAKGDLTGKSTVSIKAEGKTFDVSVDVTDKMTNEDALRQIASKVNDAKTGVKAAVEVKDGKASLSFTSEKTGEKAGFTATIAGTASKALGEGTSTAGQNAIYKVDGKESSSETNQIKLAGGLSATITGAGKANLGKSNFDTTNAVNAMKDFASSYNKAIDHLKKNEGISSGVKNLSNSFGDTRFISKALDEVGITTDSSGKLYVDEKRFSAALSEKPDLVNRIIGSADGLAGNAVQKAERAVINSTQLVQAPRSYNRFYGSSVGSLLDTYA